MTDQRDSLAREIDEELRREQLLKLWEQYGTYIIAAAVLIIAGIGGFKYYELPPHHGRRGGRRPLHGRGPGSRAGQEGRGAEGAGGASRRRRPPAMPCLPACGWLPADREAGKTAQAAAAFETIAKERGLDPLLADYARLQAAMLRLDSANWTDMQNRLNDLAADGNAWRFSARELLGLAAQKAGKTEEARTQFQRLLGDRNTPPSIGERARIMLAMLTEAELASAPAAASGSGSSRTGRRRSKRRPQATTRAKRQPRHRNKTEAHRTERA